MSTASHGAGSGHPPDSPQRGQAAQQLWTARTARWGRLMREGHMAGRNDRGWRAAADLGCLAAGCAAMFFVALRFDVPGRVFSSGSDATRLQQPMLLLGLIALALVLFGYRRWREVTATRADAARWAHRDALTGLPDRVGFQERLQPALDRPGRACVVALVIDIDRYRLVNVNYG